MVNADKELDEEKFAHLKSGFRPSDLLDFVVKTVKLGNEMLLQFLDCLTYFISEQATRYI